MWKFFLGIALAVAFYNQGKIRRMYRRVSHQMSIAVNHEYTLKV